MTFGILKIMEENKGFVAPSDVAKYFLLRTSGDGDLISPLKMQKLVYFAYVWWLVKTNKKLFTEQIEAWANGPVVPSLYRELKEYGASPIVTEKYVPNSEQLLASIPDEVKNVLNEVYDKYQTMTAFELMMLSHQDRGWLEARRGLAQNQNSSEPIADKFILEQYSQA